MFRSPIVKDTILYLSAPVFNLILSLLPIVFTPQTVFFRPSPGIAFSLLIVRSRQPDTDSFPGNLEPQSALFVIFG